MNIETQQLENHQVKLVVEFEPELVENAKRKSAREIAQRVKVPGFRPGKAPYQVILRQIGEAQVFEHAIEHVVEDHYPAIIKQADIKPYGPGSVDIIASMDPLIIEFIVPLEPKVELGDYKSIRYPYEPKQVTEGDIQEVLDDLRDRQAILLPVERPAQEGDVVDLLLSGRRIEPDEGGEIVLIPERSTTLTIPIPNQTKNSEFHSSWPYPGFVQLLVGLSTGEANEVNYRFPDDYEFEQLRSVEASYHFIIEGVKERQLPDVNDKFADSVGEYENIDALIADIRSSLEQQVKNQYNETYDQKIIAELIENSSFNYPPQALEEEKTSILQGFQRRLEKQGTNLDLYLKVRQMDMDGLNQELLPVAETQLKRTLVLYEIAKIENIQIDESELQSQAGRTIEYLSQSMSQKEARKLSDERVMANLLNNIMVDMISDRSMQYLRDLASGRVLDQETDEIVTDPESTGETTEVSSEVSTTELQTTVE